MKIKNLQLDVFRSNGQVLMQLYKQRDVNLWDLNFDFPDDKAIVIEVSFHKDKLDNSKNLSNFKSSKLFEKFTEVEKNDYFLRLRGNTDTIEVYKVVMKIVNDVYSLKNEYINYTLNAY
ncbi:hypothetical protein [Tenacibaculum halocynthiae]|uniref:hypothetical protein n=1 Tax=Tenacibaculum halocynthiae TaxID=1254437 RepID=UPI003894ED7F